MARRCTPRACGASQTVSFLLAEAWFGCRLAPAVREEAERLPARHARVVSKSSPLSPAVQRFRPNKDELWLHLSLLDSKLDKLRVARRRLIPSNLPPPARATAPRAGDAVYAAWFVDAPAPSHDLARHYAHQRLALVAPASRDAERLAE